MKNPQKISYGKTLLGSTSVEIEQNDGGSQRGTSTKSKLQMLPYWFYLAGSLCFAIGTLIVLWRHYVN